MGIKMNISKIMARLIDRARQKHQNISLIDGHDVRNSFTREALILNGAVKFDRLMFWYNSSDNSTHVTEYCYLTERII